MLIPFPSLFRVLDRCPQKQKEKSQTRELECCKFVWNVQSYIYDECENSVFHHNGRTWYCAHFDDNSGSSLVRPVVFVEDRCV